MAQNITNKKVVFICKKFQRKKKIWSRPVSNGTGLFILAKMSCMKFAVLLLTSLVSLATMGKGTTESPSVNSYRVGSYQKAVLTRIN